MCLLSCSWLYRWLREKQNLTISATQQRVFDISSNMVTIFRFLFGDSASTTRRSTSCSTEFLNKSNPTWDVSSGMRNNPWEHQTASLINIHVLTFSVYVWQNKVNLHFLRPKCSMQAFHFFNERIWKGE